YSMKALEDPEGHFGEPESLHHLGRDGFASDFPDVAEWIAGATMTDEEFGSLEDKVVNEFGEGQEAEAVEAWLEENPDVLPPVEGERSPPGDEHPRGGPRALTESGPVATVSRPARSPFSSACCAQHAALGRRAAQRATATSPPASAEA